VDSHKGHIRHKGTKDSKGSRRRGVLLLGRWFDTEDTKDTKDTNGSKRRRDALGEPAIFCGRNANSGLTLVGLAAF